jgi:hypothetical protein
MTEKIRSIELRKVQSYPKLLDKNLKKMDTLFKGYLKNVKEELLEHSEDNIFSLMNTGADNLIKSVSNKYWSLIEDDIERQFIDIGISLGMQAVFEIRDTTSDDVEAKLKKSLEFFLKQENQILIEKSLIDKATAKYVIDTVRDGVQEGLPINKIQEKLAGSHMFSSVRSLRIARTIGGLAGGLSQLRMAQISGMTHKTWHSVGDENTRKEHTKRNGQTVPIKKTFQAAFGLSYGPMFPCDPHIHVSDRVNCRCWMSFEVRGAEIDIIEQLESGEISAEDFYKKLGISSALAEQLALLEEAAATEELTALEAAETTKKNRLAKEKELKEREEAATLAKAEYEESLIEEELLGKKLEKQIKDNQYWQEVAEKKKKAALKAKAAQEAAEKAKKEAVAKKLELEAAKKAEDEVNENLKIYGFGAVDEEKKKQALKETSYKKVKDEVAKEAVKKPNVGDRWKPRKGSKFLTFKQKFYSKEDYDAFEKKYGLKKMSAGELVELNEKMDEIAAQNMAKYMQLLDEQKDNLSDLNIRDQVRYYKDKIQSGAIYKDMKEVNLHGIKAAYLDKADDLLMDDTDFITYSQRLMEKTDAEIVYKSEFYNKFKGYETHYKTSKLLKKGLKLEEATLIVAYTNGAFRSMNKYYKAVNGVTDDPIRYASEVEWQTLTEVVNRGLRKLGAESKRVSTVWRGFSSRTPERWLETWSVGSVNETDALWSTATVKSRAWSGHFQFEIKLKNKHTSIDQYSVHSGEKECLLPAGTKLRTVDIKEKYGTYHYTLEEV